MEGWEERMKNGRDGRVDRKKVKRECERWNEKRGGMDFGEREGR